SLATPACTRQASGRETRSRLDAPMPLLPRDDVDRFVTAELGAVLAPAAELDREVDLVRPDLDRRALLPLAVRPALAGAGLKILALVVAGRLPDGPLAARQTDVREKEAGIHARLVAAIKGGHEGIEHGESLPERIAHPASIRASAMPSV